MTNNKDNNKDKTPLAQLANLLKIFSDKYYDKTNKQGQQQQNLEQPMITKAPGKVPAIPKPPGIPAAPPLPLGNNGGQDELNQLQKTEKQIQEKIDAIKIPKIDEINAKRKLKLEKTQQDIKDTQNEIDKLKQQKQNIDNITNTFQKNRILVDITKSLPQLETKLNALNKIKKENQPLKSRQELPQDEQSPEYKDLQQKLELVQQKIEQKRNQRPAGRKECRKRLQ